MICISEMCHNSIIFSLIIVENVDPAVVGLNLGNLLKIIQTNKKIRMTVKLRNSHPEKTSGWLLPKVIKCFSKLGCAWMCVLPSS